MDIAAMSTMLSQAKVQQAASLSVMRMAMDNAENSGQMLNELLASSTKAIEQSVNPYLGANIDIKW